MTEAQENQLKLAVNMLAEHFDGAVIIVSAQGEPGCNNQNSARWTCNLPTALGLCYIGAALVQSSLGAIKPEFPPDHIA